MLTTLPKRATRAGADAFEWMAWALETAWWWVRRPFPAWYPSLDAERRLMAGLTMVGVWVISTLVLAWLLF